jgi:hypothetical protein
VSSVRQILAQAQEAESQGDKTRAIQLLQRAAEAYRDTRNHTRALKVLRHIRRLEGREVDDSEEEEPMDGDSDSVGESVVSEAERTSSVESSRNEVNPVHPEPSRGKSGDTSASPRQSFGESDAVTIAPSGLTSEAWCSFCCKPGREVGRLVSGPTASFICRACIENAGEQLGLARSSAPKSPLKLLRHQLEAQQRLLRGSFGLLLGPAASGKSTVLKSLNGQAACLDVEARLERLPEHERVVFAVRGEPPPAPVMVDGRSVYDTETLLQACGGLLSEEVLLGVDAVVVLPGFDAQRLLELAELLGATSGAQKLVDIALKSKAPARELSALIKRLQA